MDRPEALMSLSEKIPDDREQERRELGERMDDLGVWAGGTPALPGADVLSRWRIVTTERRCGSRSFLLRRKLDGRFERTDHTTLS
jgi:hypothetical protein